MDHSTHGIEAPQDNDDKEDKDDSDKDDNDDATEASKPLEETHVDAVPPLALEDSPALRDSLSDSDDDESSSASEASPSANAVRASGKRMARALYAWNPRLL